MKLFLKYFKGQQELQVHQVLLVQLGLQGPPELRFCLARNNKAKQNVTVQGLPEQLGLHILGEIKNPR